MAKVLEPKTTFCSIYGSELVFAARVSPTAGHWQTQDAMALDMMTAGLLTALGDMPVVCAASASTPEGLGLLRDAGFQIPSCLYRYRGTADYMTLITKICAEGRKFVEQHVHPESEIPPANAWIAPSLLSFLNNKSNLNKMAPTKNIPDREILPLTMLNQGDWPARLPIVIKAVTDESSGGGVDVCICRNIADVQKAASYFARCQSVVAEKYLTIRRNLCLHYSVRREGDISYLGFAEQVSNEEGRYQGNWIDANDECPSEAIELGKKIASAGFERGYFGVLGIDVAVLADGACKVFDLNFRGNGSSPAVLYADSIRHWYHAPVIRLRRFTGTGDYREMLNVVYRAMAKGMLLPLGSYDPEEGNRQGESPLLSAMVIGTTRQDVLEKERELLSMGLGN